MTYCSEDRCIQGLSNAKRSFIKRNRKLLYIYLLEEVNIVIQHICANESINKSEVCKLSIVLYNEFNVYQILYYNFNIIIYNSMVSLYNLLY